MTSTRTAKTKTGEALDVQWCANHAAEAIRYLEKNCPAAAGSRELHHQNGNLRVGKLRHRGVLEEELKNYRLKQNINTGHAAFEPLRDGQHDDLLFATCLGVWAWERAITKTEHRVFPGEMLGDVPVNVMGGPS